MNTCPTFLLTFDPFCQQAFFFLMGLMIGSVGSFGGAVIDFRAAGKQANTDRESLPGCIFLVTGGLGVAGATAVTISLFTGGLSNTLLVGIGVLTGFLFTFGLLALVWAVFIRRRELANE